MKVTDAIKELLQIQDMTISKLADRLAMNRSTLSMRINRGGDLTIGTTDQIVRSLDYKVVLVPRDAKLPKDSFEVE